MLWFVILDRLKEKCLRFLQNHSGIGCFESTPWTLILRRCCNRQHWWISRGLGGNTVVLWNYLEVLGSRRSLRFFFQLIGSLQNLHQVGGKRPLWRLLVVIKILQVTIDNTNCFFFSAFSLAGFIGSNISLLLWTLHRIPRVILAKLS